MKRPLPLIAVLLLALQARAAIVKTPVDYKDGRVALRGMLVYDDANREPRPGVLVVHEWKGLGDYAFRRAEALARLGYVAFAVDMYGKGVFAKDHEEAGKLSGVFFQDRALMRRRALAGLAVLKKQKRVDPERLAAIGYCFGGTTALELARAGAPLKAVASFHGNLSTPSPARQGAIRSRIAVFHGADDAWVSGGIPDFEAEMRDVGADWSFHSYPGAVHSFTVKEAGDDPSKGMAYNAEADAKSWAALEEFLADALK